MSERKKVTTAMVVGIVLVITYSVILNILDIDAQAMQVFGETKIGIVLHYLIAVWIWGSIAALVFMAVVSISENAKCQKLPTNQKAS